MRIRLLKLFVYLSKFHSSIICERAELAYLSIKLMGGETKAARLHVRFCRGNKNFRVDQFCFEKVLIQEGGLMFNI